MSYIDDGEFAESVRFTAADGAEVSGHRISPRAIRGMALVCAPHPLYGGNRHHPIVTTMQRALVDAGVDTLTFDYRAAYGDGVGELLDAEASFDLTSTDSFDLDDPRRLPHLAVGYSFGAEMARAVRRPVDGRILIAPQLHQFDPNIAGAIPTLVITPEHDQYAPPSSIKPAIDLWPAADFVVLPGADHFLDGRARDVADIAIEWINEQRRRRLPD